MRSRSGPAADFPLSHGQQALWFLHRLAPGQNAYHIAAAARVSPRLEIPPLARTLTRLLERHPVLSAVFQATDGETRQRFGKPRFSLLEVDLEDDPRLDDELTRAAFRPFDLEHGPLLRAVVFRLSPDEDVFLLAVPHVVADFWSLAILVRELGAIYGAESGSAATSLPRLDTHYGDFVQHQRRWLETPEAEDEWRFWRRRLAGLPALELPADRPRPPHQTFRGCTISRRLDPRTSTRLGRLARSHRTNLTTVVLAAFQTLLYRLGGQHDFGVGTPAAGRRDRRWAAQVGYFVNPVVVRARISAGDSFLALLDEVARRSRDAFAHQRFPFSLLAERLQPDRDPSRSPLFQAQFVFQKARRGQPLTAFALGEEGATISLGGSRFRSLALRDPTAQFDLTLRAAEVDSVLVLSLQANRDLFDRTTVERFLGDQCRLLCAALVDPERPVDALQMLGAAEAHQLRFEWGRGDALPPASALALPDLVAAQSGCTPDAIAIVDRDAGLSYRELGARVRVRAAGLQRAGVGAETRVAVSLERTPELVIALLAVLEAGGAFVPVDPAYPAARRTFMVRDSSARLLLAEEPVGGLEPCVDTGPEAAYRRAPIAPRQLAYVIYTSGSSGRPKGVAIEHRSATAFLDWTRHAFSDREMSGVLAATSISFDLSIFELFAPLGRGATVVLARDALSLPRIEARVSLVNTVPSVIAALATASAWPRSLVAINLAGEPLPATQVERLAPIARVRNLYGPSEDTTYSTVARFDRPWRTIPPDRVSIGRLLPGGRALIVDRRLRSVAIGVPGELLLGGPGLARGYLDRPALTAERFVPDPSAEASGGRRLYRTGDRVRFLTGGSLDILGRLDHQVKLRGFRIELGEIEAVLGAHPRIDEAAVLLRRHPATGPQLVAWVAPEIETAAVEAFLTERLPAHLVPATLHAVDVLPRLPNGKIDRQGLIERAESTAEAATERPDREPRGAFEQLVATGFCRLLGVERVSADDHFFRLGGHSLLATRLATQLEEAIGAALPLQTLFAAPTVARLARAVESALQAGERPRPPLRPSPPASAFRPSSAEARIWFSSRLESGRLAYNMPLALRVDGALEVRTLRAALAEIERRHEALRCRYPSAETAQIAAPEAPHLPRIDLDRLERPDTADEAERVLTALAWRELDLLRGPLLAPALVDLGGEQIVLLALHHIAADGASLPLLAHELEVLYTAFQDARPSPLPEPPMQMRDVARWQRRWLRDGGGERDLVYWRRQLADLGPAVGLPVDRPQRATGPRNGASFRTAVEPRRWSELQPLARRHGATPFMLLLAAFEALLHRLTGKRDLALGTPVAGRLHAETETLIGCFVNTLVLRTEVTPALSFDDLLRRVQRTTLAAVAHQALPFEKLVEALAPQRQEDAAAARSPFFRILFAHQPERPERLRLGTLTGEAFAIDSAAAKFELTVAPRVDAGGGVEIVWEYRRDLFDRQTIDRLAVQLEVFLGAVAEDPGRRLDTLPGLSPAQQAEVLAEMLEPPVQAGPRAPRSATEELLVELMSEVLGSSIGVGDSFFENGGHSLLAVRLLARLQQACGVDLPIEAIFEQPSAERLALRVEERLRDGKTREAPPLVPLLDEQRYRPQGWPLSPPQRRLWFLQQFDPAMTAYHLHTALRLRGALAIPRLAAALAEIVRRHDALRTTFEVGSFDAAAPAAEGAAAGGEPFQRIAAPRHARLALPVVDLAALRDDERESALRGGVGQRVGRPYDLRRGPLFRTLLFRLGEVEHALLVALHHVVGDGWSLKVLRSELATLYRGEALPELPVQPVDFAIRQHELTGETPERAYWRRQLAGSTPVLDLPLDRPRPAVQSFAGAALPVRVGRRQRAALLGLAREAGGTLFMTVLAAFQVLLWRVTSQRDLAIGVPVAGRRHPASEGLIGFFVNTLVLREGLSPRQRFSDHLRRTVRTALAAFAHQDLPFETLVDDLQPNRDPSHTPLFQVMLAWQTLAAEELALPGLDTELIELREQSAMFDLTLSLHDRGDELHGSLTYSTALFDATTIRRLLAQLEALWHELEADPRLDRLSLLDAAQEHQLRVEWNETVDPPGGELCLQQLVWRQTGARPGAVAISDGERQLSGGELERRARRLAAHLQRCGLAPEDRVALLLPRSIDVVIAFLAVLEAGGAAALLDAASPEQRLILMLEDAAATIALAPASTLDARSGLRRAVPDLRWLDPATLFDDADLGAAPPVDPRRARPGGTQQLAYVIFTSGSTGRPKGVAVGHREAAPHMRNTARRWRLGPDDRVYENSPFHFDATLEGLFASLISGARLLLGDARRWPASEVTPRLAELGATTANVATAFWQLWVESRTEPIHPGFRLIETGGDVMQLEAVRRSLASDLARVRLINAYGPTETVVACTTMEIDRRALERSQIAIGRPLPGRSLHVVLPGDVPAPIGVAGELIVGGAQMARGYLRRPARTAVSFIPDAFAAVPGARCYRTGDLTRFRTDGAIDFLGRIDQQIQLRGYRIEPAEIEAALERQPAIAQAVVLLREVAGDRRLIAYLVATSGAALPSFDELRRALARELPDYMLPADVVALEALPLNANDKIDRAALRRAELPQSSLRRPSAAPRNALERRLVEVWSQVLGAQQIGIDDNFFEIGGHSLTVVKLQAALEHHFAVKVPVVELFRRVSVRSQAELLRRSTTSPKARNAAQQRPRRPAARAVPAPRGEIVPADAAPGEAEGTLRRARLPNGLEVAYHSKAELEQFYDDIFVAEGYLRHGLELRPGACVVDAGANIGLFSLFVAARVPRARIFAIEPAPPLQPILRHNLDRCRATVRILRCALGAANGVGELVFYPENSGLSSLHADAAEERRLLEILLRNRRLEPQARREFERHKDVLLDRRLVSERWRVPIRTLSDLFREHEIGTVDLLKIDVEKSEVEVLDGIAEADWAKIAQLAIEVHDRDGRLAQLTARLQQLGFEVHGEQEALYAGSDHHQLFARRPRMAAAAARPIFGARTTRRERALARGRAMRKARR